VAGRVVLTFNPSLTVSIVWDCGLGGTEARIQRMPTDTAHAQPSFHIRPRLLMGPGPSNVHPRVLAAMAQPVLGHLDPQFADIMDQTQALLRRVFETENRLTYPVSATGSGGMEAGLVNLLEPGDEAIVGVIGYFGNRLHEIAKRTGATVQRYDKPWGEVFTSGEIAAALDRHPKARVLALVHGETSTGMLQPLEEIGKLCRDQDRLLLVDAVATLGGIELPVDAWHIDVCYSGSQKCLSAPPGLAPITFGERALEHMRRRRTKVQSWYFDAVALSAYWTAGAGRRAYHHTAPISMVYALREALALVEEEGLPARFARHRAHSGALLAGLGALGFQPLGSAGARMPIVNAVALPAGFADAPNRQALLEEHGIEVAAGLGDLAGKAWRVGLMGESASRHHVLTLLAALDSIFEKQGRSRGGAAAGAAQSVYARAEN
jgi:alanine-glyoxylate transaminase/serine-glyoxylate transaminase/serine-pyruvate transaminase